MIHKILSIEAWPDEHVPCQWTWNTWRTVGNITAELVDELLKNNTDQPLLKWFFDNGYLTEKGFKRCYIDDDNCSLVVTNIDNNEPLFAVQCD